MWISYDSVCASVCMPHSRLLPLSRTPKHTAYMVCVIIGCISELSLPYIYSKFYSGKTGAPYFKTPHSNITTQDNTAYHNTAPLPHQQTNKMIPAKKRLLDQTKNLYIVLRTSIGPFLCATIRSTETPPEIIG